AVGLSGEGRAGGPVLVGVSRAARVGRNQDAPRHRLRSRRRPLSVWRRRHGARRLRLPRDPPVLLPPHRAEEPLVSAASPPLAFALEARCGSARAGVLELRGRRIETPCFMPVRTAATVTAMRPSELAALDYPLILANTYHLALRPGAEVIAELGGLHRFMGFDGAILTDSGGYQVFSLAQRAQLSDDGVVFRSHLDGALLE